MHVRIIKNFSTLLSGSILQKIIGLLALSYYARNFSPEVIALIPLYSLVSNFTLVLFGLGIQAFIMKALPALIVDNPEVAKALIRKIFKIALGASFACIFSFVILYANGLIGEYGELTVIGMVAFAIGASFECMNMAQLEVLKAARKFKNVASLGVVKSVLWPVFIIALYLYVGVDGVVLGLASVSMASFIITRIMLSDYLNADKNINTFSVREIIKESWPFYLEGALMVFRRQGDILIVSLFMGGPILGVYYIAKRLGEIVWTFVGLADPILTPELSIKASESKEAFKASVENLIKILLYLVVPVSLAAACVVPLYIYIVSGNKYVDAIVPAVVLCLKPITEIIRLTVIGRSVLICCSSMSRFYMTMLDVAVLLPVAIIAANFDSLSFVAAAPMFSALFAGYFGYVMLRVKMDIIFPFYEAMKLMLALIVSLGFGYLVYTSLGSDALGSFVATLLTLPFYLLIFINIVDKDDLYRFVSLVVPKKLMPLFEYVIRLRLRSM